MAGMNNPPGTPRDDGEMAGNFLNPFQSESVSTISCNPKQGEKMIQFPPSGMRLAHMEGNGNPLHIRWMWMPIVHGNLDPVLQRQI